MKRVLTLSLLIALVVHSMGSFLLMQVATSGADGDMKALILQVFSAEDAEELLERSAREQNNGNEAPENSNIQEITTLDNTPLYHPVIYGCLELYWRNSIASAPLAMASDVPTPPPDRFTA